MASKNYADHTDYIINTLIDAMEKQGARLNTDQSLELVKAYAMLAQAEALQNVATAVWSVSTSLDDIARRMPNE